MKRWPIAPILVLLSATALGGGVMVALATSHDERDPAPPAAIRDVPGVVAIGRPITPYPAGDPATGQIELRIADPTGGASLAALFYRSQRVRQGRTVREECLEVGHERQLRRYPVDEGGSCRPIGPGGPSQPWGVSVTTSTTGPVTFKGWAHTRVKRLTVAGPGGTFVLPRSQHGAFAVAYAAKSNRRMVLTATLADGSKRFFRSQIPPSRQPDRAVTAAEPAGPRRPLPRLRGNLALREHPAGSRRVVLTARLTAPVTARFEIGFLGREIRMRRTGGPNSSPVYRGIYDGTRGAQRPITRGRLYPFSVLVCNDICFRPGSHGRTTPARATTFARLR